jgi:dihydroorotate dehydrogenase (fumarate)
MFITNLAGKQLQSYIYNASGINNQVLSQLKKIADSASGAVTLKSATIEARAGNPNPKYIVKSDLIPGCTLNSMGLPNEGIEKTLEYVQELKNYTTKPIIFSLSGLSLDENLEMIKKVQDQDLADLIELNLSCPNIVGKPMVGNDPEQVEDTLQKIREIGGNIKLGVKLPGYTDLPIYDQITELLLKYKVDYITCCNTLGNCLVIDPDKESAVIKPKMGLGGLAGDFIKPLALGNVWNFYQRLQGKVQIVGVGGVRTGTDAFEFLLAGADAVQIGTTFAQEGLGAFERINQEFDQIMSERGYAEINSAKGKLKMIE